MTPGAKEIHRARMRRKLTEDVIQRMLDRMDAGHAPADELAEASAIFHSWRRPERARTPGLLQRQGTALNYVRRYQKENNKRKPSPEEIMRRFGFEYQDQAEGVLNANGRITKEADQQLAAEEKSAIVEIAENDARLVAMDESSFDQSQNGEDYNADN